MKLKTSTRLGKEYQDGDLIIRQGETGDCLYVIQEGFVEVISEKGTETKLLAELGVRDFFGEMGLFENDVRSATVRSKGPSKILTIDKRNFYKTIQKDPSLAFNLLEKMSKRLRQTTEELSNLKKETPK